MGRRGCHGDEIEEKKGGAGNLQNYTKPKPLDIKKEEMSVKSWRNVTMGGHRSRWWRSRTLILKYTWIVLLCILDLSASTLSLTINQEDFLFTQKLYNATIPEMAPGKTFVKSEKKMGIFISDPKISVIYKIEDGDKSGIFKCEEVRVGDFVFLRVRTLSNSFGSLNRELESRYHLKIKAIGQISQGNSVTTTTDLIINVLDKNDLYPLFDKDVYNTTISEDTDLFTSVLTVSASDGDVGVNSDIYYRFVQKTNAFAIHPTSGVITLTRRLDYFVQSRYNFDVVAEDRGPKSRGHNGFVSRFAKITILVSRANFFSPQISFKRLPILEDSGQENGHAGIVYAIMSVTDDDIDVNGKIDSVRILEDASGSFKIFPTNDIEQYELALVKKLTESKISNNFDIVIEATDRGDPPRSSTSRIPVNIHLLGQGRKLFAQEKFEAAILENIPVGSSVTYLRASDRDIGQTSGVEYEIVGGNDLKWFKVNKNTGLVTTAVSIDAESAKFVTLKVNALDLRGEGQALSNSVLVNVTILDCNDNSPVFSINETNIAFDENLEIGASVFSVKAVDADQGDNGKISYSITNTDKVPFTINHFNGTIMMSEVLDYETMKRLYKVKVRASDWGSPFQRESEIVLHFHLGDINDNKPRFEKVDCSGYISREADVGTEVITVPAIDFDYNILSYYIISGNDDLCFTMDTISGTLILNCSMSEETANERVIVVGVRDDKYEADPVTVTLTLVNTKKNLQLSNKDANVQCHQTNASQELTRLLQISRKNNQVAEDSKMLETQNLEAQNIHAPVFNASMLIANDISENIAVGSTVLKVAAYDLDTGYNGLLKYSVIDGDPYDQFQINPSTGEISVVAKLDREQISRYDLEVLISDLAPVGLRKSSSAVISFNILDENDNVPKFEKESYEAKISEGILVNSTVIQVIARDDDLGRNGRVEYSLAADTNLFAVDPKNGIITVNKALDREVKDTYLIPIRAHDLGEKSQSATTTVKVTLLDVNDNVPKFIPEIYEIKLREDLPLGVVVATLKAEDLDLGENGKIKYQLLYGVEDTFEIDESTGIIRLVKALDFETRQVYNISAHASDGGRPPLMSACFVNIEVIDVNENVEPPVFEHFYEVGVIRENKSVGSVVMVISATDSDGPVDRNSNRSPVTYSIRDGSGLGFFTIDNDGTIRTSKVLDRETTDHYWLTVYATDRGIVPLHARLEVYIKVIDVNDNVPQFYKPVYYMEVEENSSPGRVVGQVQAYDKDDNPTQELSYSITDSDSTGGFAINSITGVIATTKKRLDRDSGHSQRIIEVTVSDNGKPNLSSTAKVIITLLDINDNKPQFLDKLYRVRVASLGPEVKHEPIIRVTAKDKDEGKFADITYKLRGKTAKQFSIDGSTGMIYADGPLLPNSYELKVRAYDGGKPRKKDTTRVRLEVQAPPLAPPSLPPRFAQSSISLDVFENCEIGQLVGLVNVDADRPDQLWYSIIDGDDWDQFTIHPNYASILVAKPLDRETKDRYNLTVTATNGVHSTTVQVNITVFDVNDNTPCFSNGSYDVTVSESASPGTKVIQVTATDRDNQGRLIYKFTSAENEASLGLFEIDSESGIIKVKKPLDREVMSMHELTVMVRDQGVQSNRNYTRVIVRVQDHNDHAPAFLSDVIDVRVFETSAVGTAVVQLTALDQDKGANAEVSYTIVAGNIDLAFAVDETLGIVSVAKELDKTVKSQYKLIVVATDNGVVPLSSTATVHIMVTMSTNAPPKFLHSKYGASIDENSAPGSHVTSVFADSQSSVMYAITEGNDQDTFAVNPNSGVVYLNKGLDFELKDFYNLTILASNIISKTDSVSVGVQIIDTNDNEPFFLSLNYKGSITESALPGTLVLDPEGQPLVIKADDKDSGQNARLVFKITDPKEAAFFDIDSTTGAIKTSSPLDHELFDRLEFYVQVSDQGHPQLTAAAVAKVVVHIVDVNDNAPAFELPTFHGTVWLPTAANVPVIAIKAVDPDTKTTEGLKFSLTDGDHEKFLIDQTTGMIYVKNETNMAAKYDLKVTASDGKFDTSVDVIISISQQSKSGLTLSQQEMQVAVKENLNFTQLLAVIQVPHSLNQHLVFTLLNYQDKFSIVRTSGVLQTKGIPLDREDQAMYRLIVLVEDLSDSSRIAHILVKVTVEDQNDNAPTFVNLPYDTVVPIDADVGTTIRQATAIDRDQGSNGEVVFSLSQGYGDHFEVDTDSGKITILNKLSDSDVNKEMVLIVQAQDKGTPSLTSTVFVNIRIISSSHPVFPTHYYTTTVREDIPPGSPIFSVNATSPIGHKLIYSIASGDPYKEFDVDFNLGVIKVTSNLDYESTQEYNLTIRASDVKTGSYAEAKLNLKVMDVNDQRPSFSHYKYTSVLSEAVPIGTTVTIVTASDLDTGLNSLVHYDIIPVQDQLAPYFEIDSQSGLITTYQPLDHESNQEFNIIITATDAGLPANTAYVPVHIIITDLNDNPPYFDQPSYNCFITDQTASLIVTKVSASDPDLCSQGHLEYAIVEGNIGQAFIIDSKSGVITVSSRHKNDLYHNYLLNISVTDGVFTSYTRVSINVRNGNKQSPVFQQQVYQTSILENVGEGMLVVTVTATDEDRGNYGMLTYTILSDEMRKHFTIDADTGEVYAAQSFDREEQGQYSVTVAVTDNGGRMGFTILNVDITDINDNVPQFSMREYKANVAANATVGNKIIQIQATDADLGQSGHVTYEMHSGNLVNAGELFALDTNTGFISVKQNLSAHANQIFQFFVTATDHGQTQLKNTVPVEIYVLTSDQSPPLVKPHNSFVIPSEEMVGTVIGTIVALGSDSLDYSIISGFLPIHNSEDVFSIDSTGQIRLMEKWKESKLPKYEFSVKVQSKNNPRLFAYSEVEVVVSNLDSSRPEFEAHEYDVTLAENSEVRTKVVRCRMLDSGKTFANVRYKFDDHTIRAYENMFAIDPFSGWITLESEADREKQDFYNLTVIAETKGSAKKSLNTTVVNIEITDHNDNPPIFSQSHYIAAVNEDALTGTILMTLSTHDADIKPNTDVEYLVVEGDPMGKFKVHRSGEIYVSKILDRETQARYEILIAATDGGMASMATITIDILDANDNTPVCEQPLHQVVLSEDVEPNTLITQIKATDADDRMTPNAVIQYRLKGDNTLFQVNKEKGVLTNSVQLDRENMAEHHLIISAVDGDGKSCDTEVYIELSDVNDNPPAFVDLPTEYSIPESTEVDTLIMRVYTFDPDLGINRQVKYKLKNDSDGTFSIDEESGILKLEKAVDREFKPKHTLVLTAYDQGTPSLTSEASIDIVLLDENDNPPEFVRTTYTADIKEDAPIGSRVVRVTATSKDIGENARMTYLITAGNNMGKFVIDQNRGSDVRVANDLDREAVAEYILTVVARDNGQPPLSSSAFVTINIVDVNDNAPWFSQTIYRTSILESLPVGASVTQVMASDMDTPVNAQLSFSILSGDKEEHFIIDKKTGNITINRLLDREQVSRYNLDVRVVNGHLFADTKVIVEVKDVNDCPPRFSKQNYTATVQEDRNIGYPIVNFTVVDDDLPPNGKPFTFDIIAGNEGGQFRIDNSGVLSTASKFNHYIKDSYYLIVRAFDNGSPPMYSDVPILITIVEKGLNPPVVKNLDISLNAYLDRFPGGIIGTLEAKDEDTYDDLIYKVISPNRHLFDVDKRLGKIIAFPDLDPGNYVINISVYDGHFLVYGAVNVEVNSISKSMLDSAITVQLQDVSPEQFFSNHKRNFQKAVKRIMNVRNRDVEILNVQPSDWSLTPPEVTSRRRRSTSNDLDVLFAVRKSGSSFYRQRKVQRKVQSNIDVLQSTLNVRVLRIMDDICPQESCKNGQCVSFIQFDNSLTPLDVAGSSYVTGRHYYVYKCICSNGMEGDSCPDETITMPTCASIMCPYNKQCQYNPYSGPQCVCPEGKTGEYCEREVPGLGRCTDFSCYKGEKPMTFAGNSYAKWTLKEEFTIERRLSLTLRMKTRHRQASLMYVKGQFDYSILEVKNGRVQYKFNCGKGEGLVVIPRAVDDGEWHTIQVERNGREAEIKLDRQFTGYGVAPGVHEVLNLNSNDVYFGAEVDINFGGYHDIRRGFDGCMEDIKLFNVRLPFDGQNAVVLNPEFKDVEFHCKDTFPGIDGTNICSTLPCMNGGRCETDGKLVYNCICPDRFVGTRCELDTDPCADSPCRNDGTCQIIPDSPNDFRCVCKDNLKGKFCEYGRWCNSNPCFYGGTCIEGTNNYICMCPYGFAGTNCEVRNGCDSSPCQNDGKCLPAGQSYICNCTGNHGGKHCENLVLTPQISSNSAGITQIELYVIIGIASGLIFLAFLFVIVQCIRRHRHRRRGRGNLHVRCDDGETEVMLKGISDYKKGCKVSQCDISIPPPSPCPPPVPNRPASYTPSNHDSLNTLNNFDNVRNYGSAADDLENCHNIPYTQEFLASFAPPPRSNASMPPSLPPPPPSNPPSDTDSIQKPWENEYPNMLGHLEEKHHPEKFPRRQQGALCPETSSFSSFQQSESEDEPDYHWDASDWAPRPSLPNISELPMREIPDSPSSSPHSNESNTHIGYQTFQDTEMYTDPEMLESEYVGDSEFADNECDNDDQCYMSPPNYHKVLGLPQTPEGNEDEEEDSYRLPQDNLVMHPNQYLPNHSFNQSQEFSGERDSQSDWPEPPSCDENDFYTSENDDNEVVTYGFPNSSKLAKGFLSDGGITDSEYNVRNSVIDRMSMSLGGNASTNVSMSDISGLCDIEDSEVNLSGDGDSDSENDETTPLSNSHQHHTTV
ncbi:hypothetical protein FSP39_013258 [Pinctada imbricata]|uniref:Uncharacterized protein n=1 Tax=Pinctada imbricata TaxID=66713 RepID=A0AA89C5C8_PINIB|nr:hypothetical protein FSP39_013258 [Pinctada imbricata]